MCIRDRISIEYNAISGKLVLTDGESQKEYQRDNLEFDLYGAYDISEEDIQRVKDSLDSVSSKNKEVSMKVMLKVRGERQMCDLKLHTLWSVSYTHLDVYKRQYYCSTMNLSF